MIKSPIPKVSNKKQFRAIGIVCGMYKPHESNLINKGFIEDSNGLKIDAVVLGKALPVIKKFINFEKRIMWEEELIGRNSVIPWTSERIRISNITMFNKL